MASIDNRKSAVVCLRQLLGTWSGEGSGGFPTMESFDYREELLVTPGGGSGLFHYRQRTWRKTPKGEKPSHEETGFISVADDGVVEVLNAQGPDRVEVMHGRIERNGEGWRLDLESVVHANDDRMRTASRTLRLAKGELTYEMRMTTDRVDTEKRHLSARLELREP